MNARRGRPQDVCLVSMLFAAASWAQLLSIPIDPDKASLEMGRRRPDGSQFVLNVRMEGSPPIRYVALREEAARRETDELSNLRTLVDTEKQRSEGLRKEVEEKTARASLLEQNKTELMDELFKAQVASKRARKESRARRMQAQSLQERVQAQRGRKRLHHRQRPLRRRRPRRNNRSRTQQRTRHL